VIEAALRSRGPAGGEPAPRKGRARRGSTAPRGSVTPRGGAAPRSARVERPSVAPGAANGRGDVVQLQRARIVSAMVDVVAERGVARSTVAHVVGRSGVSRRTFYELFDDREDCFVAAFDMAVERGAVRVAPAFGEGAGWLGRARNGLRAGLEFLDDEPSLGRLGIVDALGAGPVALEHRTRVVNVLIDAIDRGRREPKAAARLTRLTAEGIVGAVLAVLHARLTEREPRPMISLLGPLMGLIVLPYQGRAVAEREAARPTPRRRPATPPAVDPLRDLEMRLTYRTVRVLAAIASIPGASNREVSDAAGVADQGQISKLLARLEHLGLIENVGEGHAKGEPNAWRLTPRGIEVERTISRETEQAATG
jgi:AcrR family transcriptional regulator/DNA-binding MarR family transcriptional regulator